MRTYGSECNELWEGFEHRDGDLVISTRSKCGTTWIQMVCALLVHQTPDLPAPLAELSPWLDWDVEPAEAVRARLARQDHRRIIKTHTPLDGLPLDDRVTYIVVGRHPLDVAVSLYHHAHNIDRGRVAELTGNPPVDRPVLRMTEDEWVERWITDDTDPATDLDTLPGNVHHLSDAWGRMAAGNVVLVHYEDLEDDLDGSMRRLADRLAIDVPVAAWSELVEAATFAAMRRDAARNVPDRSGVLKSADRFFRSGRSGDGRRACTADQLERYHRRVAELADVDVVAWLHRDRAEPTR